MTGIGLAALAGIGLHRLPAPFRHPLPAFGAALGATIVILPGFLLAGTWPHGLHLMLAMAVPYGTAILLAIALGGLLLDRVERYREAEQRFRRMVAESPEALVVVDPGGRVRLFNGKAEAFSGLRGAEALGRQLAALGWLGDALAAHLARAQAAPARLPPFELEDPAAGKVFEALAAPVLSRMGGTEWLLTVRDVTERKRAEAARADYEARILESKSLEALGRLAGGVAHDFNNMLSVILGTTEVLSADAGLTPSMREDLAQLTTAAQRAADLTAQLLAFARRQVLEPQPLDPNAAVTGLVPLLRRSLPESIELVVRLEPSLPRVLVDATQLDQVLVNLAVNARDAMPGGGVITLETRAHAQGPEHATSHPELPPGSYVVFSVSDSGAGMTDEVRARVFEPFFTTKEHGKGTGLGLATVHGIVRQSGGTVSVYSEPGKGSCFRVYLPTTERTPSAAVEAAELPPARRSGGHVLLVEDSDLVRAPVRRMLVTLGYRVTEAGGGREALDAFRRCAEPVDLLLTDVVMRDVPGPDLAAQLARERPGLPVLFMSGYTENAIVHHGVLDPEVNFISKPFTLERLRQAMARALG